MDDEFEQIQEKRSRMFSRLKPEIWRDDFVFALGGPVSGLPEGNFKKGRYRFDFLPEQKTKGAAVFHAVLGADSFFCLLAVVL